LEGGIPRQTERAPFRFGEEWAGLELPNRGDLLGIHTPLSGVDCLVCLAVAATGRLARYHRDQGLQLDGQRTGAPDLGDQVGERSQDLGAPSHGEEAVRHEAERVVVVLEQSFQLGDVFAAERLEVGHGYGSVKPDAP